MQRTTIKSVFLVVVLASAVPLAACDDDNGVTQPGPTVSTPTSPTPAPTPEPTPTPTPTPTPIPTPPSDSPSVTITGTVTNLTRGGDGGLDITFRIDDFTVVRAGGGTPVMLGSQTSNTSAVHNGQQVTVQGARTNGFLDATSIAIVSQ